MAAVYGMFLGSRLQTASASRSYLLLSWHTSPASPCLSIVGILDRQVSRSNQL